MILRSLFSFPLRRRFEATPRLGPLALFLMLAAAGSARADFEAFQARVAEALERQSDPAVTAAFEAVSEAAWLRRMYDLAREEAGGAPPAEGGVRYEPSRVVAAMKAFVDRSYHRGPDTEEGRVRFGPIELASDKRTVLCVADLGYLYLRGDGRGGWGAVPAVKLAQDLETGEVTVEEYLYQRPYW